MSSTSSVATGAALGRPELVHLGHALLEFVVLALLVGMSLILSEKHRKLAGCCVKCGAKTTLKRPGARGRSYLALPRKVVFGLPAPVQRDQEVCT